MWNIQIALEWTNVETQPYQAAKKVVVTPKTSGDSLILEAGDVRAEIDTKTGQLVSYKAGEKECLKQPLVMNFWRAPTDNERGWSKKDQEKVAQWRQAGAKAMLKEMTQISTDGVFAATFEYDLPVGSTTASVTYEFHGDGTLGVSLKLTPEGEAIPKLPRIGFQCAIAPEFSDWASYGRGPEENYSDRNTGSFLGAWEIDVHKAWHPYTEPQETANRTEVRRSAFTGSKRGVVIESTDGQPLEISAYPFLQSDLEGTRHPADIPMRDLITVNGPVIVPSAPNWPEMSMS